MGNCDVHTVGDGRFPVSWDEGPVTPWQCSAPAPRRARPATDPDRRSAQPVSDPQRGPVSSNRFPPDDVDARQLPPRLDPRIGRPDAGRTAGGAGRRGPLVARILGATLSTVLLAGTGWGWHLTRVAEASVNRTDAIPSTGNKDTAHDGAAMNLLLVGDDSRADLTEAQKSELNTGDDGGSQNTDTMILVHVPADGSKASFVSFPRDSYVQIPGHGWDKLNAAYADGYAATPASAPQNERVAGGQQLLVQTISQLTGLQIDHFASVDLLGFFNLSNVVGGVEVNLCKAVNDKYSGARFPAGVQTISGAEALKFVRQRHGLPRGDLDRIVRQQVFLAGVARKMLSENVLVNPGKQQQLVSAVAQSLTVDRNLNLVQLAQQMQSVTSGGITFRTMPVVGDARDPQNRSILKLPDIATLHTFFANLSDDGASAAAKSAAKASAAPTTTAPASVRVQVFNGTRTSGLAGTAGTALTQAGFTVTGTGNADSMGYTTTQIRYAAGDDALAATLAAKIPGASKKQATGVTPGTVQLVLGSNFNGVGQAVTTVQTTAAAGATSTPRTAADTSCIN
jgi:LCP family protein required for cell wall assembly